MEYSLVHSAAFLVFGCAVAHLLLTADRAPELIIALLLFFCCFEVFILALVTILAEWLFEALAWWALVLGNLAASAGMLVFFWRRSCSRGELHLRRVVVRRRSWLFPYPNAWQLRSFPGSSSRGTGTKRGPGRCHG